MRQVISSLSAVEIEFDPPRGGRAVFPPLHRHFRGKLKSAPEVAAPEQVGVDSHADTPCALLKMNQLHGDRIAVDYVSREAFVFEPLDKRMNGGLDELYRQGMHEGWKCEELGKVDVKPFLFWMRRLVESGVARIVSGHFPDPADCVDDEQPPVLEVLLETLDRTNDLLAQLLANKGA